MDHLPLSIFEYNRVELFNIAKFSKPYRIEFHVSYFRGLSSDFNEVSFRNKIQRRAEEIIKNDKQFNSTYSGDFHLHIQGRIVITRVSSNIPGVNSYFFSIPVIRTRGKITVRFPFDFRSPDRTFCIRPLTGKLIFVKEDQEGPCWFRPKNSHHNHHTRMFPATVRRPTPEISNEGPRYFWSIIFSEVPYKSGRGAIRNCFECFRNTTDAKFDVFKYLISHHIAHGCCVFKVVIQIRLEHPDEKGLILRVLKSKNILESCLIIRPRTISTTFHWSQNCCALCDNDLFYADGLFWSHDYSTSEPPLEGRFL